MAYSKAVIGARSEFAGSSPHRNSCYLKASSISWIICAPPWARPADPRTSSSSSDRSNVDKIASYDVADSSNAFFLESAGFLEAVARYTNDIRSTQHEGASSGRTLAGEMFGSTCSFAAEECSRDKSLGADMPWEPLPVSSTFCLFLACR